MVHSACSADLKRAQWFDILLKQCSYWIWQKAVLAKACKASVPIVVVKCLCYVTIISRRRFILCTDDATSRSFSPDRRHRWLRCLGQRILLPLHQSKTLRQSSRRFSRRLQRCLRRIPRSVTAFRNKRRQAMAKSNIGLQCFWEFFLINALYKSQIHTKIHT